MPVCMETIKQAKHSSSQAGSTSLGPERSGAQLLRREEPEQAEAPGRPASGGASSAEQHSAPKPTHLGLPPRPGICRAGWTSDPGPLGSGPDWALTLHPGNGIVRLAWPPMPSVFRRPSCLCPCCSFQAQGLPLPSSPSPSPLGQRKEFTQVPTASPTPVALLIPR